MKKSFYLSILGAISFFGFALFISDVAYAATLSKNVAADFNAGTYSDAAHQTLFGQTGVQINIQNGPEGTRFKLPITIDNTATTSARVDYVVVVPVDTATRIAGGLMQSDCGDIRFRDADDSTAITNFEIRSCNTASSYILIKVPSIPASATKQIFMYFGSSSTLTSQSSPQVIAAGEVFEDMQSAPSGTLKGSPAATYNSTDKYVQLTTATNGVHGELEYTFNPGSNFDATFDLWAGSGSGADATYLYVYSTSTPNNEYADAGGYVLQVNDLSDYVAIQYQGQVLVQKYLSDDDTGVLPDNAQVDDLQWHPIRMTKTGNRFRVYYDNVKLIDYVDNQARDLSGTLTGVGARTGALNNIHRIRNLRISQTVVSSDAEALNNGTWESPSGGSAYNFGSIDGWGDGVDGNTMAFSATVASVSAQALVEFQLRTADTTGALSSADYISIGTASSGTTFQRTKQNLDNAGVEPKKYVQVKTVLSRALARGPVLQNFTLTYAGTPEPSPTPAPAVSNAAPAPTGTSAPSTPTCTDWRPAGVPDLFQINRSGKTATLYFTPVNDNVRKYHVVFGFKAGDERFGQVGADVSQESNSGVQMIKINELDPKVSYWFKVVPVNGCATGDWSNWLEARRTNGARSIFYR